MPLQPAQMVPFYECLLELPWVDFIVLLPAMVFHSQSDELTTFTASESASEAPSLHEFDSCF